MKKALGLALLVGGVILLIYGFSAKDSITSNVSQAVTGSPTNKTLWLLAGGAAAAIAGVVLVVRPASKN